MVELLIALSICFSTALFSFLSDKVLAGKEIKIKKFNMPADVFFKKALSIVLFFLFVPHIFGFELISRQIGLDGRGDPEALVYDPIYPLFDSATVTILILILKWLSMLTFSVAVVHPFFKKKESQDYISFFAPIVLILNIIFLKQISISIVGKVDYSSWQMIVYCAMLALTGGITGEELFRFIWKKDFQKVAKRLGKAGIFLLFYLMAFMPIYAPQLLFGLVGDEPNGFTVIHRLLIYLTFLFPFAVYFFMRNRSFGERRYMLIMLALSGFVQYFDIDRGYGISGLPLHLCNTAIVLMFFTYVFNLKGVFYFTYLVNVLGALFALLMPNTEGAWTSIGNMVFFYNHIYAIILPILGVSLKVFDRPNMKLMKKAIIAFSVYVLFAATLDGWFNNSASLNPVPYDYNAPGHVKIDYFFLYSDFFVDKFAWAYPIKYNFIWKFQVGDTLMTYHYMYILTIWAIFIASMFGMWGLYGIMYKAGDSHQELLRRKRLMRVDRVQLLKELDGRSPKEPLHPEGAHMIKINHFTKRYAGSDRKAVDDLSLEIHEGEVFGFIGHNGAGKSTTIKSLVGIQTITEGSIEIQGYDIARQPLEAKLNIGYVSDNHAVYEKLTGREYVSYVAELYMVSEKDKNDRIKKYAEMFHLEDAIDREIKSYSHGMKQKLMVISALIHNPKVWVLDEPLTGLDPTSSYQIKECMRQHANEGNIVFFSSHVIEVVEKICDRVAIISGGKLCRVCKPEELTKEGYSLEELYLKYATEGANAVFESKEKTEATEIDNNAVEEVAASGEENE